MHYEFKEPLYYMRAKQEMPVTQGSKLSITDILGHLESKFLKVESKLSIRISSIIWALYIFSNEKLMCDTERS